MITATILASLVLAEISFRPTKAGGSFALRQVLAADPAVKTQFFD